MVDTPPQVTLRSNPTDSWAYTVWSGKVYAIPPRSSIRLIQSAVVPGYSIHNCVVLDEGVREITSREYAEIQKAFLKLT